MHYTSTVSLASILGKVSPSGTKHVWSDSSVNTITCSVCCSIDISIKKVRRLVAWRWSCAPSTNFHCSSSKGLVCVCRKASISSLVWQKSWCSKSQNWKVKILSGCIVRWVRSDCCNVDESLPITNGLFSIKSNNYR